MAKKKILIHSIVFSPDGVSTAYLYNDIALRFKQAGYDVSVLTTTPHYNIVPAELKKQPLESRLLGLYHVSDYMGIKVIHVPQRKFRSSFLRILGFGYWHILSFFLGLFEKNVNLILSPSPPLTIGLINIFIGKLTGAKVIYNVQEIYPDFLINQGRLKVKFIIHLLRAIERFVYNNSATVTTIDEIFYQTIVGRFNDKDKLRIIPNFVDTSLFKPVQSADLQLGESDLPPRHDRLVIMYAGNIGHAQSWEPLLALAKLVQGQKVDFWVIGEGVMKSYLEEQVSLLKLANIHVMPYKNRNHMPHLIAAADLHFIFMSPDMEGQGFPSKVYTIMACSKPLLVLSGENTPIFNFLKTIGCAYLITDRDVGTQTQKMLNILNSLHTNPSELIAMGKAGYQHIETKYSKEIVTLQYLKLADELLVIS